MNKTTIDWEMYERGKSCALQFTYIPDFKSEKEKKSFEKGLKDGYTIRESRTKENPRGLSSAYQDFHGHSPRGKRTFNFHTPKGLVILGRAVEIVYECDKLNGGGDGKKAPYRHKFGKGVLLCMDERARGQLYIVGSKIVVTDAGIEH